MSKSPDTYQLGDYLQTKVGDDTLVYEVVDVDFYTPMIGFDEVYLIMIIRCVNGDNSLNRLMRTGHERSLKLTPYNIRIVGFRRLTPLEVLGLQA